MSCLAGYARLVGGAQDLAERMVRDESLFVDPLAIASLAAPCCAMAAAARDRAGPRVAIDADNNLAGVHGELFGADGSDDWFDRSKPASSLLRLYAESGIDVVMRLRGHFTIVIWDEANKTLHLATDRLGTRPLYYYVANGEVAFASSLRGLRPVGGLEPDRGGVAQFLLLGITLSGRTVLEGVQYVEPGSIVSADLGHGGTISHRRYFELHMGCAPRITTIRAGVDETVEALLACREDLFGDVTRAEIPLSGGLDSRTILALVSHLEPPVQVRTHSMGSSGVPDLRVAEAVAACARSEHYSSPLSPESFLAMIQEAVWSTDGMYNPTNAQILHLARHVPRDAVVAFDGTTALEGSHRYFDPWITKLPFAGGRLDSRAFKPLPDPFVTREVVPLAPVLAPGFETLALEEAREAARAYVASGPADAVDKFDYVDTLEHANRLPRFNMMGTVLQRPYYEVRHPFLHDRVAAVTLRYSSFLRSKEKLVLGKVLARLSPELAAIPYERTALPADAGVVRHGMRYGKLFVRRLAARVLPSLREEPRVAIDYPSWFLTHEGLRGYYRSVLLDTRTLDRGYLQARGVSEVLDGLFRGSKKHIAICSRLVACELWHRFFFEGEQPTPASSHH